jgi:hypothetical protein
MLQRECTPIGQLWIEVNPSKFSGVCVCVPGPIAQITDLYTNSFTTLIIMMLVVWGVLSYFDINVLDVLRGKKGRGRPRG